MPHQYTCLVSEHITLTGNTVGAVGHYNLVCFPGQHRTIQDSIRRNDTKQYNTKCPQYTLLVNKYIALSGKYSGRISHYELICLPRQYNAKQCITLQYTTQYEAIRYNTTSIDLVGK